MPPTNRTTYTFRLRDDFSKAARKIRRSLKNIKTEIEKTSQKAAILNKKLKRVASVARSVAGALAVAGVAVIALGRYALIQSAKMETLNVSFRVLIGNVKLARQTFEDLTNFAARTPFRLQGVAMAGKVMLAAGVEAGILTHRLRQLGEMSAASGRPLGEFARIFAKIKGKNKVQGEELLQLAEKGVGLSRELARMFSKGSGSRLESDYKVSELQVFQAVEKGLITHRHFLLALDELTGKGGLYFGLTAELALTLGGLWSTVADNTDLAAAAFGDVVVEAFHIKQGLSGLIPILEKFKHQIVWMGKEHPIITKALLMSAAAVVVVGTLVALIATVMTLWGFAIPALMAAVSLLTGTGAMWAAVAMGAVAATSVTATYWDKIDYWINRAGDSVYYYFRGKLDFVLEFLRGIGDEMRSLDGWLSEKFPSFFGNNVTEEMNKWYARQDENERLGSTRRLGGIWADFPIPSYANADEIAEAIAVASERSAIRATKVEANIQSKLLDLYPMRPEYLKDEGARIRRIYEMAEKGGSSVRGAGIESLSWQERLGYSLGMYNLPDQKGVEVNSRVVEKYSPRTGITYSSETQPKTIFPQAMMDQLNTGMSGRVLWFDQLNQGAIDSFWRQNNGEMTSPAGKASQFFNNQPDSGKARGFGLPDAVPTKGGVEITLNVTSDKNLAIEKVSESYTGDAPDNIGLQVGVA